MSQRSDIAAVVLTHTWDYDAQECVCGFRATSALAMAFHVADKILEGGVE